MKLFTSLNKEQKRQMLLTVIGGICGFFILLGGVMVYQSLTPQKPSSIPKDLTRVGAAGQVITLQIKSDSTGPYIEYNGQRASTTNTVGPLEVNTEYSLNTQNIDNKKRSIVIPAKDMIIGFNNVGSDTRPIRFDKPGTYAFFPGVYEPGWENMKGVFTVVDAPTTTPIATAEPTVTQPPTATATTAPTATATTAPLPDLVVKSISITTRKTRVATMFDISAKFSNLGPGAVPNTSYSVYFYADKGTSPPKSTTPITHAKVLSGSLQPGEELTYTYTGYNPGNTPISYTSPTVFVWIDATSSIKEIDDGNNFLLKLPDVAPPEGCTSVDRTPYYCSNHGGIFATIDYDVSNWAQCLEWCSDNMTVDNPICQQNLGTRSCWVNRPPAGGIDSCEWVRSDAVHGAGCFVGPAPTIPPVVSPTVTPSPFPTYPPPPSRTDLGSPIHKKIYVLIYDPILRNGQKLSAYLKWKSWQEYIDEPIDFFGRMSSGLVTFSIVEKKELNAWPYKINDDGTKFSYDEDSYLAVIAGTRLPNAQDKADYYQFLNDPALDICGKANRGEIDELWTIAGPYFGFYESALASSPSGHPGFWYNGPTFANAACNKLLPIEIPGPHEYGHRAEATMNYIYGGWQQNRMSHNWDKFALARAQSPSFSNFGCGSTHFAPNSQTLAEDYDFNNTTIALSYCDDFYNYPNLKSVQDGSRPMTCSSWGCTTPGYEVWWWQHIPKYAGRGSDGRLNNWYQYIFDPNIATADRATLAQIGKLQPVAARAPNVTKNSRKGFDIHTIIEMILAFTDRLHTIIFKTR